MATAAHGQGTDDETIELEPTVLAVPVVGGGGGGAAGADGAMGQGHVDLVLGTAVSLTSATDQLRRLRIGQAALFLALFYAGFSIWTYATRGTALWILGPPFLTRAAFALAIAAIAFSRLRLGVVAVKGLEVALFGGLMALLCLYQYSINLHMLRNGSSMASLAYSKNGVIQLLFLMTAYGLIIPNNARTTARVVLSMALASMATYVMLINHSEVGPTLANIYRSEPAGSNLVLALAGAGFAIYGAHVLNGLRSELHEAQKFGQYQLGKKLGEGGMGEVYLAEHQLLKRPCALKLIRPESGANPIALARFEREVQSAARLSHPNTVAIFDYGLSNDGTFYYVMEYLPGMSLEDLVRQFGVLPPERVVFLMRQACAGLAEAHHLGLVHRDLKPGNVFVALCGGESDVVKILDFGLVKLTQDPTAPQLTGDQMVSGTPHYMSPEQATGSAELDQRCDIYALGAVAYFALTGRPPFVGNNAMNIMIAHVRDAVTPPSSLRPDVPKDLEDVVLKCLEKKPEDRFQDVRALSKALAACGCAPLWDVERADKWWVNAATQVQASAAPAPL